MPAQWIEAHGRPILFVDYRGLRTEQMLELLEEVGRIVAQAPAQSVALVDYTDSPASMEYLRRIQQVGRELLNERLAKIAVLGVTGLKAMFLETYLSFTGAKNTRAFGTQAEALEWLSH